MSQQAARPWWADVQHLRPAEHGGSDDRAPRTGRFDRRPTGEHAATSRVAGRASHAAAPAGRATQTASPAPAPAPARADRPAHAPAAPSAPARRERREPEVWLDEVPTPAPRPKAERRTIEIRGQVDRVHGVAPVASPGPQRIRGRRADERVGPRPDRVAMWAVVLGLLLILVAAISSPGADAAALLVAPL